jgi:coenzyme F420 hydrogenase subunit beta
MASIHDVVNNGACVGCGGCSVATKGAVSVKLGVRGAYEVDLLTATPKQIQMASRVCPFSDDSANEDEIAEAVFPTLSQHESGIGKFLGTYAGRVSNVQDVEKSSSGGLTSWVAAQLLAAGEVDGVIQVGKKTSSLLFSYELAYTVADVLGSRKSRYYPVSFAEAMESIRGDGKRYAFIGVPCQIRGARSVCAEDDTLNKQIKYFLGLVCGHMKSTAYAESLGWQLGVSPDSLAEVDFRIKDPKRSARGYRFGVKSADDENFRTATANSLLGGNWGHAVFQLNACNYCDDVFAETADVVFGDAWLPKFESDWRGTNVVVTRNAVIDNILKQGLASASIHLEELAPDQVKRTQAGNFRHRWEGLAIRLADDVAAGRWVPNKRILPGYSGSTQRRIAIVRARRELSERSHEIFLEARQAGSLQTYLDRIGPLVADYDNASRMPFFERNSVKLKRRLWKLVSILKSLRKSPIVRGTKADTH